MATTGMGPGSSGMGTTDRNSSGSQPGGGQQTRDRRAAGELGTTGADTTGIGQTLRDSTYRSIDEQKSRASETLGSLAGAVRGMTQPLRDGGQGQIADYVNKAADGIERWASELRQQDLEDAVRAVEQFARRQPAMFLGLAFGAGLVAARFLKSSSGRNEMRSYGGGFDTAAGTRNYGNPSPGLTSSGGNWTSGPRTTGAGPTSTTTPDYGTATSSRGSSTGDIPRLSTDIKPAGEVL